MKKASFKDKVAILDMLRDVIIGLKGGNVAYRFGHTDTSVATACKVTPSAVRYIRKEVFGDLRRGVSEGSGMGDLLNRVERLEHTITIMLMRDDT